MGCAPSKCCGVQQAGPCSCLCNGCYPYLCCGGPLEGQTTTTYGEGPAVPVPEGENAIEWQQHPAAVEVVGDRFILIFTGEVSNKELLLLLTTASYYTCDARSLCIYIYISNRIRGGRLHVCLVSGTQRG